MLIDYIDPEKLPGWITWLDWNFYAYKISLLVCIAAVLAVHVTQTPFPHWGHGTAVFVGFCLWCVFIFISIGAAVG